MKSTKGITLMSIAIYIVLILIVIAILATVTANMQKGVKESHKDADIPAEINKFNLFFIEEVKKQGNSINNISNDKKTIEFSSGIAFSFDSETNTIKHIKNANTEQETSIDIAKNIENCTFTQRLENGKTIITVTINESANPYEYILNSEDITNNYENEEDYVSSSNTVNEIE